MPKERKSTKVEARRKKKNCKPFEKKIEPSKTLLANDTNTRIGGDAPFGCPYCLYRPFFGCFKTRKTGNIGVHTNLFARAGQDYTIAFIRQQSLSSIGFLERLPMNPPEKPLEQMYIAFSPSASEAGPAKNLYLRDRSPTSLAPWRSVSTSSPLAAST